MRNGALPNSSYDVSLVLHGDTSCAPGSLLMARPTATLQANSGLTLGIKWEVGMGDALVYETGCTAVILD